MSKKQSQSKSNQPNTLLTYFQRINASTEKSSASPRTVKNLAIAERKSAPKPLTTTPAVYDLTSGDEDDLFLLEKPPPRTADRHAIKLEPLLKTMTVTSASPSPESMSSSSDQVTFRSFGSNQREMVNTSKYNYKTWDPTKKTQPKFSSQEPQPEPPVVQPHPRIPILPPRGDVASLKRSALSSQETKTTASASNGPFHTADFQQKRQRVLPSSFSQEHRSNTASQSSYHSWGSSSPYSQSQGSKSSYFNKGSSFGSSGGFSSALNYGSGANLTAGSSQSRVQPKKIRGIAKLPMPAKEFRPDLSAEQERVLDMVVHGQQNIFFTGSAGTGKSVLLRAIIDRLKNNHGAGVAVTASTGIAACNINGSTLHSFAGIGLGSESKEKLIEKVSSRSKVVDRWKKTRVLIIDEISMVDAELFDKLEAIARVVRSSSQPFGGIQVVVTGDFFQLPPVNPHGFSTFAFEAKSWSDVVSQTVLLKHVFRQKDEVFVEILNEMRVGKLSAKAIEMFRSLSRELPRSAIEPAELYPLRKQVEDANHMRLEALEGQARMFHASDTGDKSKVDGCIAPAVIKLKKNSQVMLLKNMDATLVNGSLGIVVGFVGEGKYAKRGTVAKRMAPSKSINAIQNEDYILDTMFARSYPVVRFADDREIVIETDKWSIELPGGKEIASRTQLPLMLAWAMSIHKSQGQTLDRVRVDLGRVFEKGQAYVALSRATSLQSLQILNFDATKVMAHPKVSRFYNTLQTV